MRTFYLLSFASHLFKGIGMSEIKIHLYKKLSPSLFNLFLEFVMKDLQNLDSGIQMGDMRINNIRYADDTTLMDLVFEKLQISTNELEKACSRTGGE